MQRATFTALRPPVTTEWDKWFRSHHFRSMGIKHVWESQEILSKMQVPWFRSWALVSSSKERPRKLIFLTRSEGDYHVAINRLYLGKLWSNESSLFDTQRGMVTCPRSHSKMPIGNRSSALFPEACRPSPEKRGGRQKGKEKLTDWKCNSREKDQWRLGIQVESGSRFQAEKEAALWVGG